MACYTGGPPFLEGQDYKYGLSWIVCKLQELLNYMQTNEAWKNDHMADYQKLYVQVQETITRLNQLIEQVNSGDFPDDVLQQWAANNMESIIRSIVLHVFFGLTKDGYFAAYIPQTWDFIQFDTIVDSTSDLWGHLVLRW